MNIFKRDLIEAIVLGLVIGLIGVLGIIQYQQTKAIDNTTIETLISIKQDIKSLETEIIHSEDFNLYMFKIINAIDSILVSNQKLLSKGLDQLPQKIKYDKVIIEKKLQACNVVIHNETLGALGSGVTLKYKGKYYILTAGHMLNEKTDKLTFSQNGEQFGELEVIKWEFDPTDKTMDGVDLLLLQPKNKDLIPKIYIELADYEPLTATEIYIVGNPMGIESVVTDGRVMTYDGNYMLFIDHSYFGNSGGLIATKEGKLLGINSIIMNFDNITHAGVPYVVGGCMRLDIIKNFLKDIE